MDRRSSIILIALGLVNLMPVTVGFITSIQGLYGYPLLIFAGALVPIAGLALIAWGVYGLIRKPPGAT